MREPVQDPKSVILGIPNGSNDSFGTVVIETLDGESYRFPVMNVSLLKRMLPENGRRVESAPCLVLVNAAVATLSIPFRVIGKIEVEGSEVLWLDEQR